MRAKEHMEEILRVEREIARTKSWKRKNDLEKYHKRLEKELLTYLKYRNV